MPNLADNFNLETDQPLDARTLWPTVQAALQGIKPHQRTTALFVRILANGGQWYSFQGGINDEHFQPAPFEQLKLFYSQLPTPDIVRDMQDIPIGTCATFRQTPPETGWIPVVSGQTFDRVAYPTLYAALGTNVMPNETSQEGTVYIKAEQVSIARTDAMTPFNYLGGMFDQKIANVLAQLNTLIADLNYNEEIRKRILETTIGPPAAPTESLTTLNTWLFTFKRMLAGILNDKSVVADRMEPFYDLIQKVDTIQTAEEQTNPGVNVQCRIGETVVRQDCPGPGWIESNGSLLDHPDTTGEPLRWPEYYDYFYNVQGYEFAPLSLAVPVMTNVTSPCGRIQFYKGDQQTAVTVSNIWYWLNRSTSTPSLAKSAYDWNDPEPLYLEYEFANGDKYFAKPKNIRRFGLVFSAINVNTAYPTSFIVQGYDPKTELWIDLMTTEEFEAIETEKEYVFDFPNDYMVTAVRLKMMDGISSNSYSIFGLCDIIFYESIPFQTPAVSKPERKVWIKVATVGNDLGVKPVEYPVASARIERNEIAFMDDFSTGRIPFLSTILNGGIATSANSYDTTTFEHEGKSYHFFGSGLAQSATTSYYMISYFTDDIMDGKSALAPILCFNTVNTNSGTAGTPARFFRYGDKLHFVAACYHVWRLDYPERLETSPKTAWVRVMSLSLKVAELYNVQDIYHFNADGVHYSYHVLNGLPWLKLFRWDLENFTEPVEVPIDPSMELRYLSRSTNSLRYHFFRHGDRLYFLCWDQSSTYRLKMFRQDAPDRMTLLKSQALPYTNGSVSCYFCAPPHNDIFLHEGKYVFCCGYTHNSHTPLSGSSGGRCSSMIVTYDFEMNEFEFPEMRTYLGNKLVADDYSSFGRIIKIRGDYYLFSANPASLVRIDMDRRVMVKGEPIQSTSYTYSTFVDVFTIADRYLLHFYGATGAIFDFAKPRVLSMQDFQKLGSGRTTGRTLVALDTAIEGQTIRCQELVPWPIQMMPQLANGPPGLGSWNDYLLPKRETE